MTVKNTTWVGCYDDNWQGLIVPDAFAHPAKFSRGLIQRIYQHLMSRYGLKAGMCVIDPFGGVALGGLDAMLNGLHWQGIELEEKFCKLGAANIALWQSRWGHACSGSARLLQGDSRRLAEILAGAECCVTSPPYAHDVTPRQSRMENRSGHESSFESPRYYGDCPGQLGAMPSGDVSLVLSSPPYADADGEKGHPSLGSVNKDAWGTDGRGIAARRGVDGEYGPTPGQLANARAGSVAEAIVSSPPYEGQELDYGDRPTRAAKLADNPNFKGRTHWQNNDRTCTHYGDMGAGETFWSAFATILEQCHLILCDQGILCLVCKDFVRKGVRVPFSADTVRLAESRGFRLVEWIKASFVREVPKPDLFGGPQTRRKKRVSFFRRLSEKRGAPPIDEEDCLIFRRV